MHTDGGAPNPTLMGLMLLQNI